jgi:hypothetical protein
VTVDPDRELQQPNITEDRDEPASCIRGAGTEIAKKLPAESDIGRCAKGVVVPFMVHASRGEDVTTTIRLSVAVAIAKGRTLADEGWQVFITGPDGVRYAPSEFDRLLSLDPVLRSPR